MTTAEVADYLRIKERTVYEMVSRRQIPCSRATGKLLFSRAQIDAWVESHTEMPQGGSFGPPPIYAGASDPLLEWALRRSGAALAILIRSSRHGLERIARGDALVAGVHLRDRAGGGYNVEAIRALVAWSDVVAIHWASRAQGLLVAPGNPLRLTGIADLARPDVRVAARGDGSGGRMLLETLLAEAGIAAEAIDIADSVPETQADLVAMIESGEADCGLGLAAGARGLRFVPLGVAEDFDLVLRRRDYFQPPFQALLRFARTPAFAARAAAVGGYDLARHGEVQFNG